MNIFVGLISMHDFFFHLIFPCANIFFSFARPPHKFSSGPFLIPSTDVIQLTLTTAQVVETSVTVNNNSPIQDYVNRDEHTQPTYEHCFCYSKNVASETR